MASHTTTTTNNNNNNNTNNNNKQKLMTCLSIAIRIGMISDIT